MGVGPAFNIEIPFETEKEAKEWLESQNLTIETYEHSDICEGEIIFKGRKFEYRYLEEENEYWGNGCFFEKALIIAYRVDYTEEMFNLRTNIDILCELEQSLKKKLSRFYATSYTI